MACDDRQLTEQQRVAGYQNGRTGVVQALRPFSGRPTLENLLDYLNRELVPAVRAVRTKVNDVYLPVVDNAPSGNPLGFYFSTDTTAGDPTAGRIRFNASPQDTATIIRVSEDNGRLADVAPWLDVMAGGATTPLGVVTVQDAVNPTRFARFDLNTMTDQGSYWDLGVTPVESSHDNPFVDGGGVVISFIPGVGGSTPATVPPGSLSPVAANSVIGNPTASTAPPQAISVAASRWLGRGSTGNFGAQTGATMGEVIRRQTVQSDSTSSGTIATYTINEATTQVRFSGSGTATIHGMTATSATFGKSVEFHVESGVAGQLVFMHESGSAGAAGERLRTPSGQTLYLRANESVLATYYDNRWRFSGVGKSTVSRFPGAPIYDVMAPPFNAAGDGTTDDTAAINAAIAAANAVPGDIYLGPGHRITAGLDAITASNIFVFGRGPFGSGTRVSVDTAAGADVFTFSACQYSGIKDVWIIGSDVHTSGFAIRLVSCYRATIDNVVISQWFNGVEIDRCTLTNIYTCNLNDLYGPYGFFAHGDNTAACHATSFWDCSCGTPFPQAHVGPGRAWATSTAYVVGNVVFANGNLYQAVQAGTSSAAGTGPSGFPSTNPSTVHSTQIVDGTVRWVFAMGLITWFLQGSYAATFEVTDSGAIQGGYGISVEDTSPGVGSIPLFTRVFNFQADHVFARAVRLRAGAEARISNLLVTSMVEGFGVEIESTYSGDWEFVGGTIFGCNKGGFLVRCGDGAIVGMQIGGVSGESSNAYDCIAIENGVDNWSVVGCSCGTMQGDPTPSSRYGISVAAGSDNYILLGNRCVSNVTAGILNTPGRSSTRVLLNNVPDLTISPGSVWGLQVDGSTGVPIEITGDEVGELLRRFNGQTDSTSSGTVATYAIANTTTQVRVTGSSAFTIAGMTASSATFGKTIEIHVESGAAAVVTLAHESGSAGAANQRLRCPGGVNLTLSANESAILTYWDSRWRVTAISKATAVVSDGDKGDITVSSSGTVWTIDNSVVTNAKRADMAQSRFSGRAEGAGTGAPQDLTPTQAVAIIDGENATWTGVHSFTGSTHTVTGSGDVRVETSAGGLSLAAGHAVTNPSNTDVVVNASGGIVLTANATTPNTGASLGEVALSAEGTIRLLTAGTERLEIEADGAWQLAGSTGSTLNVMMSQGSASPPIWATNDLLRDALSASPLVTSVYPAATLVTNSTTKTDAISHTLGANTLSAGDTFEMWAHGRFQRAGSVTATGMTFRCELNGTATGTLILVSTDTTNPTTCSWAMRIIFTCLTTGGSGTCSMHGSVDQNLQLATNPLDRYHIGSNGLAIATTASNTIALTVQFSAAAAGTSMIIDRGWVRRIL